MLVLLIIFYVLFAVSGSTLLKLGGLSKFKTLFTVPVFNFSVSSMTLLGFIFYGLSFLTYVILLNKYELSFISPLTVGLVYVILMVTSFMIFKEPMTLTKIIGSSLILVGVLLIVIQK